jgi:hypothetical protein
VAKTTEITMGTTKLSEEWAIGVRQPSTVSDWKKLIGDFRDQFPYDPLTALIVETFANALDAEATKVDIRIDGNKYIIVDNGKGMTNYSFKEYHNIASLTKKRGEGIGFAGVGAKVFLDRADGIITETRSTSFNGATHWAFYGDSLQWEPIAAPNKLDYPTGTYVEVKVKTDEDINKLNSPFIERALKQYYNAALLGYYRLKSVAVNGKEVKPWQIPEDTVEKTKQLDFRYGGHHIYGFFLKSTTPIPEEYQGPFIVVYGKTVMQEWFRQFPLRSETFHGLILADHLIDILRTSKSDFERTSMLWKKFYGRVGRVFSCWLDEIGARPKPPPPSNLDQMTKELEKSINEILKMPELSDVANTIFQNLVQKITAISSAQGGSTGTEIGGAQTTTGTIGGLSIGEGMNTLGDEEGKGIAEDETGIAPIERVRRRVRGGIKIGYDEKPESPLEGWIDPGKPAIVINIAHPAWKVAQGLTLEARDERVRLYHTLRTIFVVLVEEAGVESPKETIAKLFSCWYSSWIK